MENKKLLAAENHKNGNSCSQAVNLAFCDVTGLSAEAAKEEAAPYSKGAKIGCGAYMAAQLVLDHAAPADKKDAMKAEMEQQFTVKIGSTACKEIKEKKLRSCRGCVEDAAELLQGILEANR